MLTDNHCVLRLQWDKKEITFTYQQVDNIVTHRHVERSTLSVKPISNVNHTMTLDYKCKHQLSLPYRDLRIRLLVRGAICSPLTEPLHFHWLLVPKQKNVGLRQSCVAYCCAICLPRGKEIWGASIRLINEGRNKCGYFLQQCVSDNTVRLEKLRDKQQLSCWINFYYCLCRTKERVGCSPAVAWPADTRVSLKQTGSDMGKWRAVDWQAFGIGLTCWCTVCLFGWLIDGVTVGLTGWLNDSQTPCSRACF
jgi:hypothetical protein